MDSDETWEVDVTDETSTSDSPETATEAPSMKGSTSNAGSSHEPGPEDVEVLDEATVQLLLDASLRKEKPIHLNSLEQDSGRVSGKETLPGSLPEVPEKHSPPNHCDPEKTPNLPTVLLAQPGTFTQTVPDIFLTTVPSQAVPRSRKWIVGCIAFTLLLLPPVAYLLHQRFSPSARIQRLSAKAAAFHYSARYSEAVQLYESLFQEVIENEPERAAQIAYLTGGAYEQEWKQSSSPDPADFRKALAWFDKAVRLDPTRERVLASEALLAESELLMEAARRESPFDEELEQEGWVCLAELIKNPAYQDSPVVRLGIPHRLLARHSHDQDPDAALLLLLKAKQIVGDFDDGSLEETIRSMRNIPGSFPTAPDDQEKTP